MLQLLLPLMAHWPLKVLALLHLLLLLLHLLLLLEVLQQ
jgi:hypothetical protein